MEPKPPPLPPLPPFPGDAGRFKLCPICGQRFDTRDEVQVFHHGPEPHEPLP